MANPIEQPDNRHQSHQELRLQSEIRALPSSHLAAYWKVWNSLQNVDNKSNPVFLKTDNRQTIGRLVSQLDNLPLAIELVAAQLNIFNVDEIEKPQGRFDLLRSRSKGTDTSWSTGLVLGFIRTVGNGYCLKPAFSEVASKITAAEKVIHCGTSKDTPPVFDVLQDLCDDSLLIESRSRWRDSIWLARVYSAVCQ